jgi:hypothetical protein
MHVPCGCHDVGLNYKDFSIVKLTDRLIRLALIPMPWQRKFRLIRDLNAPELMRHAQDVFSYAGWTQTTIRLLYRAIELDPYNTPAIQMVIGFFGSGVLGLSREDGLAYSAAVLEYALGARSPIQGESRTLLLGMRVTLMARQGFVRYHGEIVNEVQPGDQKDYEIDEPGYVAYLAGPIQRCGGKIPLFKLVHAILGLHSGLLVSHQPKGEAFVRIHPEHCAYSQEYKRWLLSDVQQLVQSYYNRRLNKT